MQKMKEGKRLLTCLWLKENLDLNLKFTPSCLRHFKRRFLDCFTRHKYGPNRGRRKLGGEVIHRVGEANDSCNLNTTFLTKWEISLFPGPRTETVHWWVCDSGTTSGGFLTWVSGVA